MQSLRLADSQMYAEVARWHWDRCARLALHGNRLVISKNGTVGEIEQQDGLVLQQDRGPDCWAIFLRRDTHHEVLAIDYDPVRETTFLVLTLGSWHQQCRFELPPALGRRYGALIEQAAAAWNLPRVPILLRDCI